MSTFKSHLYITERPGTAITVVTSSDGHVGIIVADGGNSKMIKLDPADAPAIALAVLEAAGVEGQSPHYGADSSPVVSLRRAAHYLGLHAEQVARDAAATAEEAELEAEAEALYQLIGTIPSWEEASEGYRDKWISVARRARELAKERAK